MGHNCHICFGIFIFSGPWFLYLRAVVWPDNYLERSSPVRYSVGIMVVPFLSPVAITIPILVNHLYLNISIICNFPIYNPCYGNAGVMLSGVVTFITRLLV